MEKSTAASLRRAKQTELHRPLVSPPSIPWPETLAWGVGNETQASENKKNINKHRNNSQLKEEENSFKGENNETV